MPESIVGNFRSADPLIPAIVSFAAVGGLACVPVLDHRSNVVTSSNAKIPALSKQSLLNVYSSSHTVHGIPKHIEQVSRNNLELELLTSLVENDLHLKLLGSKLSIVVADSLLTKQKLLSGTKIR